MELLLLIVALLISLLIALLALANKETVSISYLFGEARVSLIILILASACAGAVITGALSLLPRARSALRFRDLRRQLEELRQRRSGLEQENALLAEKLRQHQAPPGAEPADGGALEQQPEDADR